MQADLLIIGAGITGAFLAEAFSRAGKKIIVLDRNQPQTASTMASTSLLQWEIDAPLSELALKLGLEKAAEIYRASFQSVSHIASLVSELKIDCAFANRHTLYLEGEELFGPALRHEYELRRKIDLPCEWMDAQTVGKAYGFPPRAAIRSTGNAEADPVALARGLLLAAIARGAKVIAPAQATSFDFEGHKVYTRTDDGLEIVADTLLLATGYEIPAFVQASRHKIISTYAVATGQQKALPWPARDLVWEAADPYFYMRTAHDLRIIIGGEDKDIHDAAARDALLPQKAAALQNKLRTLLPHIDTRLDYQWCAFFGTTEDSLPMIGRIPGTVNAYGAYGYGGNGITFSALAAQILRDEILGLKSEIPARTAFVFDRD